MWHKEIPTYREVNAVYIELNNDHPDMVGEGGGCGIGVNIGVTNGLANL